MSALLQASKTAAAPALPDASAVSDRLAFGDLYETHFAFVWRSALRLGVPRAHVDDVVQETFLVVHRRLASFEGRSSMKTWLFGILANIARAHRRTAGTSRGPSALHADPEAVLDPAAGPDECATRAEAVLLVDRLLDALDDEKRAVFILAELEQMSAPDIASALATPLNTVYSRLRLARQEFAAAAARSRARDEWRTR